MDSRERAREWMDRMRVNGRVCHSVDELAGLIDAVRREERERCAGVCEDVDRGATCFRQTPEGCAAAIREMANGPD